MWGVLETGHILMAAELRAGLGNHRRVRGWPSGNGYRACTLPSRPPCALKNGSSPFGLLPGRLSRCADGLAAADAAGAADAEELAWACW